MKADLAVNPIVWGVLASGIASGVNGVVLAGKFGGLVLCKKMTVKPVGQAALSDTTPLKPCMLLSVILNRASQGNRVCLVTFPFRLHLLESSEMWGWLG